MGNQPGYKSRHRNTILVVEKGAARYPASKMQGAGIQQRELTQETVKEIKQLGAGAKTCFVIGTDAFQKAVQKTIRTENLHWNCVTKYRSTDDMMKQEGYSFPETVAERSKPQKEPAKPRQNLGILYAKLLEKGLDEETAASILLAAEEVSEMKIFPMTSDNIYRSFLKTACEYLQDDNLAKQAVDAYLQVLAAETT